MQIFLTLSISCKRDQRWEMPAPTQTYSQVLLCTYILSCHCISVVSLSPWLLTYYIMERLYRARLLEILITQFKASSLIILLTVKRRGKMEWGGERFAEEWSYFYFVWVWSFGKDTKKGNDWHKWGPKKLDLWSIECFLLREINQFTAFSNHIGYLIDFRSQI